MISLNCKGKLLVIDRPVVMGIINTTPDSFYTGSRSGSIENLLFRAEKMISEGATFLDIGGQSTRPDSIRVSVEEELQRVIPAIEVIHKRFPEQIISIDTFYAKVATAAIEAGASLVNDVSGGTLDEAMWPAVAALAVPYVLMHMKGTPQTMQQMAVYENVTLEVFDELNKKIELLKRSGVKDIIVDPGFGFAKTAAHNFHLLRELEYFSHLQCPLMVGLSRKATVYKTLGVTPEEALNGTTVLHTIALMNGASILRVHDVKEAMQAIRLVSALQQ